MDSDSPREPLSDEPPGPRTFSETRPPCSLRWLCRSSGITTSPPAMKGMLRLGKMVGMSGETS